MRSAPTCPAHPTTSGASKPRDGEHGDGETRDHQRRVADAVGNRDDARREQRFVDQVGDDRARETERERPVCVPPPIGEEDSDGEVAERRHVSSM